MIRVRLNPLLSRIPSIKFKKGGIANGGTAVSGATGGSQVGGPANSQPTATMSTLPDYALPARYRRTPLSAEEIASVNGGGIRDKKEKGSKEKGSSKKQAAPQMLGSLKIPKGILIKSPGGKGQVVSLNVTLQRGMERK